MTRSMFALLVLAALALAVAGCGPVQATALAFDTEAELEAAESFGAEQKSAYEYWSAKLYLHKSKELVGHADHEHAIEFGTEALRFAKEAKAIASDTGGAAPAPPPVEGPRANVPVIVPSEP